MKTIKEHLKLFAKIKPHGDPRACYQCTTSGPCHNSKLDWTLYDAVITLLSDVDELQNPKQLVERASMFSNINRTGNPTRLTGPATPISHYNSDCCGAVCRNDVADGKKVYELTPAEAAIIEQIRNGTK